MKRPRLERTRWFFSWRYHGQVWEGWVEIRPIAIGKLRASVYSSSLTTLLWYSDGAARRSAGTARLAFECYVRATADPAAAKRMEAAR